MSQSVDSVRSEIIERLKCRDLTLTVFSAAFATLAAVAFNNQGSMRILLSVPFLAITFTLLAVYHDSVISYLHRYVKRTDRDGWDNSEEIHDYFKSKLRWTYFIAQILSFGGASSFALLLNYEVLTTEKIQDQKLLLVWYVGCAMTLFVFICLFGVRLWRLIVERRKYSAKLPN